METFWKGIFYLKVRLRQYLTTPQVLSTVSLRRVREGKICAIRSLSMSPRLLWKLLPFAAWTAIQESYLQLPVLVQELVHLYNPQFILLCYDKETREKKVNKSVQKFYTLKETITTPSNYPLEEIVLFIHSTVPTFMNLLLNPGLVPTSTWTSKFGDLSFCRI